MINKKLLIFIIVVIILLAVILFIGKEKGPRVVTTFIGNTNDAVLRLSPSSGSYGVGETFQLDILLETNNYQASGVDIRYLRYPNNLLEVQDANASASGIQITPGSLFPNTVFNLVDSATGRINFSQTSAFGSTFKGNGVLATITFKVLGQGTADVNFDFTLGDTTDTNVAGVGEDVLSGVENGSYNLVSDNIPPAAVNDLSVSSVSSNSVELTWTAPGDDGNSGTASSYDLRYSLSSITQSNWSSAVQVTGEPTPQSAGTAQSMVVSGLAANNTYYFALKTSDESNNISALSNIVNATVQEEKRFKIDVKPEGRTDLSNISVRTLILNPGTETVALEDISLTDNLGNVTINMGQFSQNIWDIRVIVPHYLYKKKTNVVLSPPETLVVFDNILAGNLQDIDNVINSLDWSVMNNQWGRTDKPAADINQDGIVNTIDWSFMNKNWGLQGG